MLETNTNNNNNKISIADRFVNEGSIAILLCTIIITVYITYYDIKILYQCLFIFSYGLLYLVYIYSHGLWLN
jgi:hypothetical protein